MEPKIITKKQDLTYLKWSHVRNSSGTTGTFMKSQSTIEGDKTYYKLSNFDSEKGIIGHENVNEIIVDRLLDILEVPHLSYQLIYADIEIDGITYDTWICASKDFKAQGETKAALDDYYFVNKKEKESHYDFCMRNGWDKYIDSMLAIDYLILNRDRHGANIEILRNARKHTIRIAPLFDHGLSLLCSCYTEEEIKKFDVTEDKPCNNFIGSRFTLENLGLIQDKKTVFTNQLRETDRGILFRDVQNIISEQHMNKIWEMIWTRWCYYENLCNL